MSNETLIPCPFCGVAPIHKEDKGISDIFSASAGGYELRHNCFENIRGNEICVRSLIVRGETKADVIARWNRRSYEQGQS